MPVCKNERCGKSFASAYWVGGKKHNLGNRTYCLECSPFGLHNTRKLDGRQDRRRSTVGIIGADGRAICPVCRVLLRDTEPRKYCFGCAQRARTKHRNELVHGIVGTACWKCGYDKGFKALRVLEWHHVDPATKLFELSARETTSYAWDRVATELKKCVLMCCRCHREHHAGLISSDELETLRIERWSQYVLPAHS